MAIATHPHKILVGVDFSDASNRAFEQAFELARRTVAAELHVVSIVDRTALEILGVGPDKHPSFVLAADTLRDRLTELVRKSMAAFRRLHPETRSVPTFVHVRVGHIAEQVTQLAGEIGIDLVVVGTNGRTGMKRLLLGSVAERVVRLAPCAVLVVRPKNEHVMDGIPVVEPPCPDCVAAREASGGREWWCKPHKEAPPELHAFSHSHRLDDYGQEPPYK